MKWYINSDISLHPIMISDRTLDLVLVNEGHEAPKDRRHQREAGQQVIDSCVVSHYIVDETWNVEC